jgi:hypothetical protein
MCMLDTTVALCACSIIQWHYVHARWRVMSCMQPCSCYLHSERYDLATDNRHRGHVRNLHCICSVGGKQLVMGQRALVPLRRHSQQSLVTLRRHSQRCLLSWESKNWRVQIRKETVTYTMVAVFWDVTLCSLVQVYCHFRGLCCLHTSWQMMPATHMACIQTLYNQYKSQCLIQHDQIKLHVIISGQAMNHTFKRKCGTCQN